MASDEWEFCWQTEDGSATGTPPGGAGAALGPGDRFAGYEVHELLGAGGMGSVFRATDREAGRDVALKVLHQRARPDQLERLRREGELTAALDHPGIVRVHAGGDVGGRPYLAYALVPGARSLDEAWSDLDRRSRLKLLHEIALAVGHAHAHGIVHRDLKPENVLVDSAGAPHLVDFGLGRHADQERLTQTGAMIGTPLGMAPEQFSAQHDRVGPWTDVFALGILLYRALTDAHPFDASGWVALARAVTEGAMTPLREHDPSIPAPLERIVRDCLAVEPEARYPNATALAEDLDAALTGRPLSSGSAWTRALERARRPTRALAAVLALAAALLALGVLFVSRWSLIRGEGELRQLVADLDPNDVAQRARLRARLAAAEKLPAPLRASAELALAGGESSELAGWRTRLEHARRAGKLDPTRTAGAARREATCLLALELAEQALPALRRAREADPGDASLRRQIAEALLATGRPDLALAELTGSDLDVGPLRARALFETGRQADGRALAARLARERPAVEIEVLVAELEQGRSDSIGRLQHLVRLHPALSAPRIALARAYLRQGAPGLAARVLADGPASLAPAGTFLACVATQPDRAPAAATRAVGWRRPALRCALLAARRDLGWRNSARVSAVRSRFARTCAGWLALARALRDPAWKPEAEALRGLEQELATPGPPLPDPSQLPELRRQFNLLRDRQRNDAPGHLMALAYRALWRAHPTFQEARLYAGKAQLVQGLKRAGLQECLAAARSQPALFRILHSDTHRVYDGERYMRHEPPGVETQQESDLDRLRVAFELVIRLEVDKQRPHAVAALPILDGVLQDDPSDWLARSLRGFVLLRLGRTRRATWDLSLAASASPSCAVTVFYRLLLAAELGRPLQEQKALIQRLQALDFQTWRQRAWDPQRYPELRSLLDRPELRKSLLGGSKR